jgi:hypothetical protein
MKNATSQIRVNPFAPRRASAATALFQKQPLLQTFRQELGDHQATHHATSERTTRSAAGAVTKSDRQRGHQRRHRRHHDRAETQEATLIDRIERSLALFPRFEGKVDHHDGVFLHDANKRDDITVGARAILEIDFRMVAILYWYFLAQ